MSISALCSCQARIEAPDELAGQSVKCPKCGIAIAIPGSSSSSGSSNPGGSAASSYGSGNNAASDLGRTATAVGSGGSPGAAGAKSAGAPSSSNAAGTAKSYREDTKIPADLRKRMREELQANEQIVWMGMPVPAMIFSQNILPLIGGSIAIVVGLIWLAGSIKTGKLDWIPIIISGIGLFFAAKPFYYKKMAERTCYALTNKRALVLRQGLSGLARESYSPLEVAQMYRRDSKMYPESGDLVFKSVTVISTTRSNQGTSTSRKTTHYGFVAIRRVREIDKLVRETLIDRFVDKLNDAGSL